VAQNPNARYVWAQFGTFPGVGCNSFGSPGINIWNIWLLKNTKLSEGATLQLRLDAFSIFSHCNFSLAQPPVFRAGDLIGAVNNVLSQTYVDVPSGLFLNDRQFTGGQSPDATLNLLG